MCYAVFLSTSSREDLSAVVSDHYRFEHIDAQRDAAIATALAHPNVWYVACRFGGCSCHFRHIDGAEPEDAFSLPAEWFPEDPGDIESTAALFDELSRIVQEGNSLDVVDSWNGEDGVFRSAQVSISNVSRDAFRFSEGYRYELVP